MSFARSILCAAVAALVAPLAIAADPVRLDKGELEKMLPGKTINYSNVNGTSAIVTFAADGRVTYKGGGGGKTSTGTWSAEENGRYCVKITSGTTTDHCRSIWKTDAGYMIGQGRSSENLIPVSGLN